MGEEGKISRQQYIADRLVEFRKNKGLSALEVARQAGITQSTLWRYEKAQFAKLDVLTLVKIAKVLGGNVRRIYRLD